MFFAANWKMHQTPEGVSLFFKEFLELMSAETLSAHDIVFFPPSLLSTSVHTEIQNIQSQKSSNKSALSWGLQNIFFESQGSFTGENSAKLSHTMGARFALVGHSERRQLFNETDESVAKKVAHAFEAGLCPVICVGETLEEKDAGRLEEVLTRQVQGALGVLTKSQQGGVRRLAMPEGAVSVMFAYEPVWAIGTGRVATMDEIAQAHAMIKEVSRHCKIHFDDDSGSHDRGAEALVLYGGSVKPGNAKEILSHKMVDGVLVGGASLNAKDWSSIVTACDG